MAYRDGSGAITIDEIAAANDIRRIREAEGYLAQSRQVIIQLMELADGMTGQTADAIRDKAYELQTQVDKLNSRLVESRHGHTGTNAYTSQGNVVGILGDVLGGGKAGKGNSGGGGRSF